jgi:hypothetical protein
MPHPSHRPRPTSVPQTTRRRLLDARPGRDDQPAVHVPADHDIVLTGASGASIDAEAALRVYEDDPAGDVAWFSAHPAETERIRPITPAEVAALSVPADVIVTVTIDEHGPSRLYQSPPRR